MIDPSNKFTNFPNSYVCSICLNYIKGQKICIEGCSQNQQFQLVNQNATSQSYQQYIKENQNILLEECYQISDKYYQFNFKQLQSNDQDSYSQLSSSSYFEKLSIQQDINYNYQFALQSQNINYCLQNNFSDQNPNLNTQQNSPFQPIQRQLSSSYSSFNLDNSSSSKILSPSPKIYHQNDADSNNNNQQTHHSKHQKKDLNKSSMHKSYNQSIIKNNIRDFLTPIIRMKSQFVDFELLKKEKLTPFQYQNFLVTNFCAPNGRSFKIRQSNIDSIFDYRKQSQLIERKVFAITCLKSLQQQFVKLLIQKKSQMTENQLNQQFEWINNINDNIIYFLNSI
ncbi:hypothetical protein ABPG74_004889 [Tetrahymena malaccensis]